MPLMNTEQCFAWPRNAKSIRGPAEDSGAAVSVEREVGADAENMSLGVELGTEGKGLRNAADEGMFAQLRFLRY